MQGGDLIGHLERKNPLDLCKCRQGGVFETGKRSTGGATKTQGNGYRLIIIEEKWGNGSTGCELIAAGGAG